MADRPGRLTADALEAQVASARSGDADAMERVLAAVRGDVYALALRTLWHPEDAEDATQEILLRLFKGLRAFRGDSAFRTWVYRVAVNTLRSLRPARMETRVVSFDAFGADLDRGLAAADAVVRPDPDRALLLEEVKIGCTLGMLLCLDREHRLAYILGDIMELDHREAAAVLDVAPATYRKRLSRARRRIVRFMTSKCGLFDPANACRCSRRLPAAIALERVDPARLLFAAARERASGFPRVLVEIRTLEETRRAAALYRSHPVPMLSGEFAARMRALLAAAERARTPPALG